MPEYIEREMAYKLIKEQREKETGAYSKDRNAGLFIARSIINNKEVLPTADVVEVKYGEWERVIKNGRPRGIKCSLCGKHIYFHENYCPRCGAKMDGGNE